MNYGQFCPVAKASEVIGEKWTILILRELLLGTTRFSDFQRSLSKMSPTLLSKRLKHLEESGIVINKKIPGQRGSEYRLSAAGKELSSLVEILAIWGMRWARSQLSDDELDIDFLMREMQRRLQTQYLPDGETTICLVFDDIEEHSTWWLLVEDDSVDVCTENPGKDVDIYVKSDVRTIISIWEGDISIRSAVSAKTVKLIGSRHLIRSISDWFAVCIYKDVQRGDPKLLQQLSRG
jgi:DNA-binding HxlR family transcriptional regulator